MPPSMLKLMRVNSIEYIYEQNESKKCKQACVRILLGEPKPGCLEADEPSTGPYMSFYIRGTPINI
jgi:hypothetical protein